ncbi:cytochrome c oxidase accessory protein CcoG [bacterium]|nr:cytochrome c oxidase accessory protein CcoG [bacterium]
MTELDQQADATQAKSPEAFRDRVANIDKSGHRIWIYPKKPKGTFHRLRAWFSVLLIAIMIGVPFIQYNGHPFVLLNVVERKFILFGLAFWPQDFHIFALAFLSLIIFIVLFTAVFGRVWCGWACPQTVFMEMVFRKIEYLIEGDAAQQRTLDASPNTPEKILKKTIKHIIFFVLSFVVGNILLAYIIGVDALGKIIIDPPQEHWVGLFFMTAFSLIFYGIFARFREQACIYVCPYGRLQSVLLDKNSIVVAYDFKRGEPRGAVTKNSSEHLGDCIDCKLCVQVCPTGIDIRNGTQLECVNCTACIDACDAVMEKIKRPKKLIRYASINLIAQGQKFGITPRIILYSAILTVLLSIVTVLLLTRNDIEATVLRAKGSLYQVSENGNISNLYTANIVNKTFNSLPMAIKLENAEGVVKLIGYDDLVLPPDALIEVTFIIELKASSVTKPNTPIKLGLYSGSIKLEEIQTAFIGPMPGIKK